MPGSPTDQPERARLSLVDAVVGAVLVLVAAFVRRDAAPTDGLWFDDAWVAVGARSPLADLFTVCTNHPGFTLGLQALNRVVPDRVDVLAWPVLAAGILTAPLLFVVARRLGASVVAAAVGALFVAVSVPHAMYSGRVKPYVVEAAVIAVLAFAVDRLAGRTWRWTTGVAWLAFALACASLGAFGFVAAALATLVLAVHPVGDRAVRWAVLGVQAVVQGLVGARMAGGYDSAQVAEDWESTYDGYLELVANPFELVGQLWQHLGRLGQALVDVPLAVAAVLVVAALAGLVGASIRGGRRPAAQLLLALPLVALVGSVARQVPFGPVPFDVVFPGARASLWLLPSLAFGLAVAIDAVAAAVAGRGWSTAWVAAVGVAAVATAVVAAPDQVAYGELGTRSATAFIEARREPETTVFYFDASVHMVGSEPPVAIEVTPDPDSLQGFVVDLGSGRVPVLQPAQVTPERIGDLVGGSDLVLVHDAFVGFGDSARTALADALEALGFRLEVVEPFPAANEVEVWVGDG